MRCLIRVFTICLHNVLLKKYENEKYHPTTLQTEIDWSNLKKCEIPFDLSGLTLSFIGLIQAFRQEWVIENYSSYSSTKTFVVGTQKSLENPKRTIPIGRFFRVPKQAHYMRYLLV